MQHFEAQEKVMNKRECKIIRMLANGKTITEVAKEMFVSKSTIEKNLVNYAENSKCVIAPN